MYMSKREILDGLEPELIKTAEKVGYNFYKWGSQDRPNFYRYTRTDIVIVNEESRTITLNNGGWYTITTKRKMNQILAKYGYYIFQVDYEWYIKNTFSGEIFEFHNEIRLNY